MSAEPSTAPPEFGAGYLLKWRRTPVRRYAAVVALGRVPPFQRVTPTGLPFAEPWRSPMGSCTDREEKWPVKFGLNRIDH